MNEIDPQKYVRFSKWVVSGRDNKWREARNYFAPVVEALDKRKIRWVGDVSRYSHSLYLYCVLANIDDLQKHGIAPEDLEGCEDDKVDLNRSLA